jgi:hypothetical protein
MRQWLNEYEYDYECVKIINGNIPLQRMILLSFAQIPNSIENSILNFVETNFNLNFHFALSCNTFYYL